MQMLKGLVASRKRLRWRGFGFGSGDELFEFAFNV
jgi:hypothetical protein